MEADTTLLCAAACECSWSDRFEALQLLAALVPPSEVAALQPSGLSVLHRMARSPAAVKILLEAAETPEAAMAVNDAGQTPLHLAVQEYANEHVIRLLLAAAPAAVAVFDAQGRTPLQLAADFEHGTAVDMLAAVPGADAVQEGSGWTALHAAAACGHTEQVSALLAAAPDAAQATDEHDKTALHYAAALGRTAAVEALLSADPGGAAATETHNAATIKVLVAAAPATAAALTGGDETPLHLAAQLGGNAETLQPLLAAAPEAAMAVDAEGCTPLHHAATWAQDDAAELLLAAAPEAAEACDDEGLLPLQRLLRHSGMRRMVILNNSPQRTLIQLLAAGPAAMVLQALLQEGEEAQPFFADFITARPPLSEAEWALVPVPCQGLGSALPTALAQSSAQASRLVQHLPDANAERLRTFALCLARAQRRAHVSLPTPVVWRLLAHFDAPLSV